MSTFDSRSTWMTSGFTSSSTANRSTSTDTICSVCAPGRVFHTLLRGATPKGALLAPRGKPSAVNDVSAPSSVNDVLALKKYAVAMLHALTLSVPDFNSKMWDAAESEAYVAETEESDDRG